MPRKAAPQATPTPDYEEYVIRVPKTRRRFTSSGDTVMRHVLVGVIDVDPFDDENSVSEVADRITDYGVCTKLGVIAIPPEGPPKIDPIIVEAP